MSGAFDCFEGYHRRQYMFEDEAGVSLIEKAIRFGNKARHEKDAAQQSLFGAGRHVDIPLPKTDICEPYTEIDKLKIEKEVVGFYISGHPLDQFKFELKHFCNTSLAQFKNMESIRGMDIRTAGIVVNFSHRITKSGKPYGTLTMEDYDDSHTFYLFSDDYLKYKKFFEHGWFLYIKGSIQPQRWKNDELDFKILGIDLLAEVRDKYCDGIKIKISAKTIDDEMIEKFLSIVKGNSGKCSLIVNVWDETEKINIDLFSRKLRVSSNDSFIRSVEEMPGMELELIRH
jgi:DNA polymerase-3 subunit alpha